jgi:hypothetical protein
MKLKGKQYKRVRRYRILTLKREVVALKNKISKMGGAPVLQGEWGYVDVNKQMTQPLPATIDKDAWGKEFDTKALCEVFGVPYELYEAEQSRNNNV